jgi:hypothetical protein
LDRSDPTRTVRLAAVGDLLLAPGPPGAPYPRDPALVSPAVRTMLAECDVVFGNLECTLPGDGRLVPTEPRVVATPELVRAVRQSGFTIVTLANNHAFDCLEGGFLRLRRLLDEIGLPHFGAGLQLDEAAAPAVVECNGLRLVLLGAVDRQTGPLRLAAADGWGVAPLDVGRLARQVRSLRDRADHVIVSLHWGEERFLIPSPEQMVQARALIDAGASMVLGHHPHVLQGLELWHGSPIAYSLGNFIADEVYFTDGDAVRWSRTERTGCILLARLGPDGAVAGVRLAPTYDAGRAVELDGSAFGRRQIDKVGRAVARGISPGRYRREHLRVRLVRPALARLRWSRLKTLRFGHLRKAWRQIRRAGPTDD